MKITFLGTCAGTEPMPERKHASVVMECGGRLYWIDAGDGCARTGHLLGLDLLKINKVIISHAHMDHIGGLGNLLWYVRKLRYMKNIIPKDFDIYTPNQKATDAVIELLKQTEGGFKIDYNMNIKPVADGLLFDDGTVKVTAFHNMHINSGEENKWLSYSYLIETEDKKIVYSGDVKNYEELDMAIGDGCDALIIETGHFGIDVAYEYIKNKNIGKIFFSHNGREILNYPKESQEKIEKYFNGRATICEDEMTVEI